MTRPPITGRLVALALCTTVLAACGGSDSPSPVSEPTPAPTPPPPPSTTAVSVTVIDGAIKNAKVCLDVNGNGACDADEPSAVTDAAGKAALQVPNERVGKHPVLASVGTDAVDADLGAVTTAFTLSAPADKTAVISPLTTLAQYLVQTQGVSSAVADAQVQSAGGLAVSALADYTLTRTTDKLSADAGLVAAAVTYTLQRQYTAVQSAVSKSDASGAPISRADVELLVRGAALDGLPTVGNALAQTAAQDACKTSVGSDACKAELQATADKVVAASGLTESAVIALLPAIKKPDTAEPEAGVTGASFRWLSYAGSTGADWYYQVSLSNAQEDTAVNGVKKWRNLRREQIGGAVREWNFSRDYNRRNDSHWTGSAWTACPDASFQHTNSVRDAAGRLNYDFCSGREKGSTVRSSEDIAGKTLGEVVKRIRAFPGENAGVPFARWGDPISGPAWTNAQLDGLFGTTVFPPNSKLHFQTPVSTETAFSYDVRSTNQVLLYSAAVAAGGDARSGGTPACADPAVGNASILATKLEDLLIYKGTPCRFDPRPANATYLGSGPINDWWANSTLSIGTVGNEPLGTAGLPLPAPFATSNQLIRVAFTGNATDRKTSYYQCLQRRDTGSTRNCTKIGEGTYDILTLGDARVMTLQGVPMHASPLTYERIFVERGGAVYFGYRDKPRAFPPQIRLNLEGANAVLQKLGFAPLVP